MDQYLTYALIGLIAVYFAASVVSRRFDPFAPVWLFLVGYVQVYVVQAISYRDWALGVRGADLVTAANARALWACVLFLAVYQFCPGRLLASALPAPPRGWSRGLVSAVAPFVVAWGLVCSSLSLRAGVADSNGQLSPEGSVLLAFPFVMLVGANMLIVTGRSGGVRRPLFLYGGVACAAFYVALWMLNGKRSHSLMGILSAVCAFYISKAKRPSWPVLIATACAGMMAVGLSLGWRFKQDQYERSLSGFVRYVSEFDPAFMLECFNIETEDSKPKDTYETEEWGGFLLMMDTVPEKSDYDYGSPYLRIFSTYIPRFLWQDKPLFGREQWISAWIAGSERKREAGFTGPAIGILGATQLNGGGWATAIVCTGLALFWRTAYEFFRRHSDRTWAQCWWAVFYFNAWFSVVNDDPMVWFYYNWGFTTLPLMLLMWFGNLAGARHLALAPAPA